MFVFKPLELPPTSDVDAAQSIEEKTAQLIERAARPIVEPEPIIREAVDY